MGSDRGRKCVARDEVEAPQPLLMSGAALGRGISQPDFRERELSRRGCGRSNRVRFVDPPSAGKSRCNCACSIMIAARGLGQARSSPDNLTPLQRTVSDFIFAIGVYRRGALKTELLHALSVAPVFRARTSYRQPRQNCALALAQALTPPDGTATLVAAPGRERIDDGHSSTSCY